MTWEEVNDIIYDGNRAEISGVRCPTCGGRINYSYVGTTFKKGCEKCGYMEIDYMPNQVPNCVLYFGEEGTL